MAGEKCENVCATMAIDERADGDKSRGETVYDVNENKQVRFSEQLHEIIPTSYYVEIDETKENVDQQKSKLKFHFFPRTSSEHTKKLKHVDSKILLFRKEFYQPDAEPLDDDGQGFYRQQTVGGQPIYVQGPPPPPMQGGRMPAYRSGQETREAREATGRTRPLAAFFNFGNSSGKDSDSDIGGGAWMFDTVEVRNAFVRKVYTLLTIQLFFTFGFIFIAIHVRSVRLFLLRNIILFYVAMGGELVLMIALVCCQGLRRNYPCNLFLLALFTFFFAYTLATLSCIYSTTAVYLATGTTAGICFLVSILACQMKYDLTQCGCILYILLMGLMVYSLICLICSFFVDPETFKIMHMVYGGLGVALFTLYLMYDTQLIMGGRSVEISPEEYVLGTIQLYLDIIMIFQHLLILFRE